MCLTVFIRCALCYRSVNGAHIRSEDNTADCASRGMMPSALPQHQLYWYGLTFLLDPPHEWGSDIDRLPLSELPKVKPTSFTMCLSIVTVEWFTRFSSYDELIHVVARMRWFVDLCCKRSVYASSTLTRVELDDAVRVVITASQRAALPTLASDLERLERITSKPLERLCTFVDSDGIIYVFGRLRHSDLTYNCRHPVLLAKRSYLALLVCRHWHKVIGHHANHG